MFKVTNCDLKRTPGLGNACLRHSSKPKISRSFDAVSRSLHQARIEMETDNLTERDVAESILNARDIYKKLRSTSPSRNKRREYLYVIQGTNLDGLVIYTKGKLVEAEGTETYYFLVSAKRVM